MLPHDGSMHIVDVGATALWLSTFVDKMPSIAAALSVIWFALRVLETRTVQRLLGKRAWVKRGTEDES